MFILYHILGVLIYDKCVSIIHTLFIQGDFFTGTPQFQYQQENRLKANHDLS